MKIIGALLLSCLSGSAQASWSDWWKTPDQQGEALLAKAPKLAAERFVNPQWKAVAEYRSGNYQAAANQWNALQSHYNHGNALARSGDYPAAIKAYEAALKENPKDADAAYNKALLEQLLKQQKQQQQENQSASSSQSKAPQNQQKKRQDSQKNNNQKDQDPKQQPSQKSSSEEKTEQAKQAKKDQEQKQAEEQWLNQVQDDQAGLLQRKFYRDHHRYLEQGHFE